eukprot:364812-Chlamydomonas_euryale.AAC.5
MHSQGGRAKAVAKRFVAVAWSVAEMSRPTAALRIRRADGVAPSAVPIPSTARALLPGQLCRRRPNLCAGVAGDQHCCRALPTCSVHSLARLLHPAGPNRQPAAAAHDHMVGCSSSSAGGRRGRAAGEGARRPRMPTMVWSPAAHMYACPLADWAQWPARLLAGRPGSVASAISWHPPASRLGSVASAASGLLVPSHFLSR